MSTQATRDLLNQGRKAFEDRDFQEAFRLFSLAIYDLEEKDEESIQLSEQERTEAYILRGTALWREDEPKTFQDPDIFHQVLNDLEQALDVQPRNAALLNLRGRFYLNAAFDDFRHEAKEDFKAALEVLPDDPESLRNMGEALSKLEEYSLAADYLTKAIDAGDAGPELWLMRGVAFFKKIPPEFQAAAADFGQAEVLAPEVEETYVWRAQCFQEMQELELAIQEYDKLISFAPKAAYFVDRGVVKLEMSMDEALADFEEALELEVHPLALNNRAAILRLKGDLQAAENDAREALRISPDFAVAHATLAEVYADQGNLPGLKEQLSLAIDSYYDDVMEVLTEPAFEPYLQEDWMQALLQKA